MTASESPVASDEQVSATAGTGQPLRVLVVYYSQSGDVTRAVQSFTQALAAPEFELVHEQLRPLEEYPYPWRSLRRFFNLFPECVTCTPPKIERPKFDLCERFDLVILAYQVWFLSPSLPIQAFFHTDHAAVLGDAKVITLSVSRNMWQSASETMKHMLREAGARHIDNAVITHQGPPWATFVTTTRALFFGKKDRLWGIFPPAGIRDEDFAALSRFGEAIAQKREQVRDPRAGSLFRGLNPVPVNRLYVLPELLGWYCFSVWARVLRFLGSIAGWLRVVGIYCFFLFLLGAIVVGLPLVVLGRLLLYPLLKKPLADYVARLQQPSEGRPAALTG